MLMSSLVIVRIMMKIDLPYRFPRVADQIQEEAGEYRRLTSSERFLAIADMMVSAEMMLATSPHREQILQQCEDYERQWQRMQTELFARNGF